MFKITKDEEHIYVSVCLEKRTHSSQEIINIYWYDALSEVRNKFPDVQVYKKPNNFDIASNNNGKNTCVWIFDRIVQEKNILEKTVEEKIDVKLPKQESAKSTKPIFTNKKQKTNKKKSKFYNKSDEGLTKPQEPATVEETSQSLSDQPVIVQEPTE